jgi:hypothetical protein
MSRRLARSLLPIASTMLTITDASADTISRLQVEITLNDEASIWVMDADNHHLTVKRRRIPRHARELGFACGAIVLIGSPRWPSRDHSYSAALTLQNSELFVAAIHPFSWPLSELL